LIPLARIAPLFPYTTLFRSPVQMGLHQEPGLERRRGQEHPPLQRGAEEAAEPLPVDGRDVVPAADVFDAQEDAEHSPDMGNDARSEEHTSELQSRENLVCRL